MKSEAYISKSIDKAMDKGDPSNGHVDPGVSIRMGPVEEMDVDTPAQPNGHTNGKRKSRGSTTNGKSYKEASGSSDDDKPLVRYNSEPVMHSIR